MVKPPDIAFVRIGQRARVNITAYDPSVYGSLRRRRHRDLSGRDDQRETGECYYIVQIRTEFNALKDHYGHPLPIGTGMVADVSLLGEKRTILQYILTPITRITRDRVPRIGRFDATRRPLPKRAAPLDDPDR